MSDNSKVIQMVKVAGTDVIEPRKERHLKPKVEQALRLYAVGHFKSQYDAAKAAGVSTVRFNIVLHSEAGQAIVKAINAEMEFRFQQLMVKTVNVIDMALDHPDPAIALAGANMILRTQKGSKVNVELSAEDVVQQIMAGTYQAAS